MEEDNYFIIDIETCPIDLKKYGELDEEEKNKLINPIDSKIIAIGIRYKGKNIIFSGKSEKEILEEFWIEWKTIKKGGDGVSVVGFNIKNFDLPFITSKSVVHNVVIAPFLIKQIIDLREKINAYRYGHSRGTLKEYAELIGASILDMDGGDIAQLCIDDNYEKIIKYLENDLVITEKLYERVKTTDVLNIDRW